jgi:hypothetical protein
VIFFVILRGFFFQTTFDFFKAFFSFQSGALDFFHLARRALLSAQNFTEKIFRFPLPTSAFLQHNRTKKSNC